MSKDVHTVSLWQEDPPGSGTVRCNICLQAFSKKGFKIHFGMKHMRHI